MVQDLRRKSGNSTEGYGILIIFYYLCYYSCPNFSPFAPFHPAPLLPEAIPTPLFMSMGHAQMFFGYSISYTVLYIPMAIL